MKTVKETAAYGYVLKYDIAYWNSNLMMFSSISTSNNDSSLTLDMEFQPNIEEFLRLAHLSPLEK